MASQGWIALHRQIQEHWIWEDKPFSKGQAWIDLLLLANHDDNKFMLGSELIEVKCGSLITSIEKLKARWGWSNTKVYNFLNLLENDKMITKKSDTKKTAITIENYSKFSTHEKTKTIRKRNKNDTKTMREHTNNNDNNVNNENNNKLYSDVPELNDALISFVEYRKKIKKPMTDHAVELMINKLNTMTYSISEQIDIINQSIVNGWQGIFPLKDKAVKEVKPKSDYQVFMDELEDLRG